VGDTITEADVRLFTTLARFDAVYHGHFKCNRNKLTEMPVLWAYARDLFQTPGFGDTIDFDHIKRTTTRSTPTSTRPASCRLGPDLAGWLEPRTAARSSAAAPSATARRPAPLVMGASSASSPKLLGPSRSAFRNVRRLGSDTAR
jgi:glutathionyl-hydroquinone reductase